MIEHGVALGAGARIEEFEVVRELGAGGFGITYLARDLQLDRAVAIKEYLPLDWGTRRYDGTVGPRSSSFAEEYRWGLERFVEEARVLARLNHSRIVRVYRVLEAVGTAYMVMEYVEGRSLEEELKSAGRLGEARMREILEGLADGLAAVHAAGLMHRDLKPANVMLRVHGGTPVLIDFGAARQRVGRESRPLTQVLTPGYAPFEQYRSKGDQGPWTDIYALGALAYTCLSGRVPDEAPDRVADDRLPSIGTVVPGLSRELTAAVDAALAVDERDRPQDVEEWLGLLGASSSSAVPLPPPAPPPPRRRKTGKPAGKAGGARRWGLVGTGVAAAIVGVLWFVLSVGSGVDATSGSGEEPAVATEDGSAAAIAEEALALDRAYRILVQKGLAAGEHYGGEFDGLLERTELRAGLREWQSAQGIEATGYLTREAAEALWTEGVAADSIAEVRRLAEARREADSIAGASRLAEERRTADSIAEARRLADSIAEARRVADAEARRVADSIAEASRLAEERRTADSIAELRRPGRVFRDCAECPELVVVPPGSFMMGSPASEAGRDEDEGPRHEVTIGYALAVGVYEVTFAEWDACVRAGGCGGYRPEDSGRGRGRRPVINVSWEDAQAYVAWLSRETGEEYRLPSEAEWEYVARAGTQTARYWGGSETGQCRYANGRDNSLPCSDGYANEAPVGSFEPSAFGLYDVLGNVWEWTDDCWNGSYAGAPTDGGSWASGDCSQRVLRGGSWNNYPDILRSAYRNRLSAGYRVLSRGFRLARTID